jgi:hypothetical protein
VRPRPPAACGATRPRRGRRRRSRSTFLTSLSWDQAPNARNGALRVDRGEPLAVSRLAVLTLGREDRAVRVRDAASHGQGRRRGRGTHDASRPGLAFEHQRPSLTAGAGGQHVSLSDRQRAAIQRLRGAGERAPAAGTSEAEGAHVVACLIDIADRVGAELDEDRITTCVGYGTGWRTERRRTRLRLRPSHALVRRAIACRPQSCHPAGCESEPTRTLDIRAQAPRRTEVVVRACTRWGRF